MRPPRPAAPGHTAKRDNEYQRCGTANVFAVVEPKGGRYFTSARPNRTAAEFAKTLGSLLDRYPSARTIHLVWDNLNIHCKKSRTDYYGEEQGGEIWSRLKIHPTPIHGSWLNQAEIELSLYSRQCLGSRRIPDLETLQGETRSWKDRVNRDQVKINWKFDRRAARKKFVLLPLLTQTSCAARPLRSTGVTPLLRYYGPGRHPLVFHRLPGFRQLYGFPAPPISRRDEKGFSSCLACPCHRAVPSACLHIWADFGPSCARK